MYTIGGERERERASIPGEMQRLQIKEERGKEEMKGEEGRKEGADLPGYC